MSAYRSRYDTEPVSWIGGPPFLDEDAAIVRRALFEGGIATRSAFFAHLVEQPFTRDSAYLGGVADLRLVRPLHTQAVRSLIERVEGIVLQVGVAPSHRSMGRP